MDLKDLWDSPELKVILEIVDLKDSRDQKDLK